MKLLFIVGLLFPFLLCAQKSDTSPKKTLVQHTYAYSFNTQADSAYVQEIARKIQALPSIYKVKGRFKPESKAGEFIIFTKYEIIQGSEQNHNPFDGAKLKQLMIKNHLQPKDLRILR